MKEKKKCCKLLKVYEAKKNDEKDEIIFWESI